MTLTIIPTTEAYFEGLRQALDSVAREKRFLAFTQAPPPDESFAFFRNIVENDLCHFIAIKDDVVVGWCDILPTHGEARAHVVTLGVGLIPSARHSGIGAKLIEAALSKAWSSGYTRIELTVRTDNVNAKALYERFGFIVDGVHKNAFFVDGIFYDVYTMSLLNLDGISNAIAATEIEERFGKDILIGT